MELINSRCKVCSPHDHQCSACLSVDKTAKKAARAAITAKKQLSVNTVPIQTGSPHILDFYDALEPLVAMEPAIVARVVDHLSPLRVVSPLPEFVSPLPSTSLNGAVPLSALPPLPSLGFVSPPPSTSLNAAGVVVTHVFPAMGGAAPLSINGQVLFPMTASPKNTKSASKASATTFASLATKLLPVKRKDPVDLTSESSEGESADSSSSQTGEDDEDTKRKEEVKKKKLRRITKEEQVCVCDWISKPRKDGKMLNGRWVRNGGAKGSTMTATSSEVKTSGAFEALAMCERARTLLFYFGYVTWLRRYVNRRFRHPTFSWTKDIAKKRWTAMSVF
jgi:hypothetical protein